MLDLGHLLVGRWAKIGLQIRTKTAPYFLHTVDTYSANYLLTRLLCVCVKRKKERKKMN